MYWYSMLSSAGAEVRRKISVERRLGDLVLHVQAIAQHEQLRSRHLLDLVGGVAALDVGSERPTLDRLARIAVGAPVPRFSVAAL